MPLPWRIYIKSKEHAEKIIRHVSTVFIVLGGINIIIGLVFLDIEKRTRIISAIIGIILVILAILLRKQKKVAIPIILLIISLLSVIGAILSIYQGHGGNPIIGLAMVIASIHAFKATSAYNRYKN